MIPKRSTWKKIHERRRSNMQFIGPLAAILTTISFIPQAVKVIKTKDTSGISLGMYIAFVLGVFLWIIHGWYIQDYNLIIANAITFVLSSTILVYKIRYK
jgi:MtN3 and saliva related transmembrane protein